MKIKVHPLFLVLAVVLIVFRQGYVFVCSILAVVLHEFAHSIVAKQRGYLLNEMVLLPYGAVVYGKEQMDKESQILIAISGPLFNLFLAIVTIAMWWIWPSTYYYTLTFFKANIVIAAFNVLPVFPLDGSRVVLAMTKNKFKTLKVLKKLGVFTSFILMTLFIVSAFYTINFTLGILAVFLYVGAISGTNKEMYTHIANVSPKSKSLDIGVVKRTIYVSKKITLLKLLRLIKPKYLTTFVVVDDDFKQLAVIGEKDLLKYYQKYDLRKTIMECKQIVK